MSDEQFNIAMEKIRKKDKAGLREIYEAYISFIFQVVLDLVRQRETAEDITSEFFIKLWEKAENYRPGSGHRAYLAVIARNMAIDYLRKAGKEVLLEPAEDENGNEIEMEIADTSAPTPEQQAVENVSVEEALSRLKPLHRQIVTMKVLSEMTFKEIAEVLKIPMGTVTWNFRAAVKQLRRYGYE